MYYLFNVSEISSQNTIFSQFIVYIVSLLSSVHLQKKKNTSIDVSYFCVLEVKTIMQRNEQLIPSSMDLFAVIDQFNSSCLQLGNADVNSLPDGQDRLHPILKLQLPKNMLNGITDEFAITVTFAGSRDCVLFDSMLGISESTNENSLGVAIKVCNSGTPVQVDNLCSCTYKCTGAPWRVYLVYPNVEVCDIYLPNRGPRWQSGNTLASHL